jgi:hypothetical protein
MAYSAMVCAEQATWMYRPLNQPVPEYPLNSRREQNHRQTDIHTPLSYHHPLYHAAPRIANGHEVGSGGKGPVRG